MDVRNGDKQTVPFKQDLIEGIKYNLWLPNTIKDAKSLPKSALLVFTFLIVGLAIYFFLLGDYTFWGILSIVGLVVSSINLVLVDNGKLSSFLWAILCSICSAIGALHYQMYGDLVYYFWCFPWLMYGIGEWRRLARESGSADETTQSKKLTVRQIGRYIIVGIVSYCVMYIISVNVGGAVPLIDSGILALGVVGQVLLSKSYRAQWVVWIMQDVVGVVAWSARLYMTIGTPDPVSYPISMVIMWGIFLVNAIYGCWQWYHAGNKTGNKSAAENAQEGAATNMR